MTSTVCVASSTRGATNVIGLVASTFAVGVEDLHRQADAQIRRAIDRNLDVRLERAVVVDGRDHRGLRDPIAFADRDVADDAGLRRGDAVVLQLDLLLVAPARSTRRAAPRPCAANSAPGRIPDG